MQFWNFGLVSVCANSLFKFSIHKYFVVLLFTMLFPRQSFVLFCDLIQWFCE